MSNGSWENIYKKQGEVQYGILNTVVEAVELFKHLEFREILDLGCGTGRNTFYLVVNGFTVTACDISQTGITIAKENAIKLGFSEIIFDIENMFDLKYRDNSFDAVLCVWTQGHGLRSEIQKSIRDVYRILRPNGITVMDFVTDEDPTYGVGLKIASNTFIGGRPGEEDIPHYYTNESDLKDLFSSYSEVRLFEREYEFKGDSCCDHVIKAIVVHAKK